MAAPSQSGSSLSLSTALGTDALFLLGLSGGEHVSRPFEFALEAEAATDGADLTSLLGGPAGVTLTGGDGTVRQIHGRVWSVRREGRACRLTFRPWLSLLALSSDNRIFQDKSTTDIVAAVFDAAGFSDYRLALTGTPATRPYCVQFGESDLAFVSRLLEEEGLGYYFEHSDSAHTLVIFDDVSGCATLGGGDVPFLWLPPDAGYTQERRVQTLVSRAAVAAGKVAARDFNFETPSETLEVSIGDGTQGQYLYPGRYGDSDAGQDVAKRRLEALESEAEGVEGTSPWRMLAAGATFTLSGHPEATLNGDYLVRSVEHRAERRGYEATFDAQPKGDPWRPLSRTTRPRMAGPQTAKVTGPSGEEIWTDKHGRVKVQFHWDRDGKSDENSSCWLRVAQVWAGAGWGAMVLPRIGQEVVVSFLDGDPDRPLVTGVVYNAEKTPPYALPAEQTKTVLKSDSSKDAEGSNELRFEDKADEEEVYLHAQKDMTVAVENDRTTTVGHDETVTVTNARSVTVSEGDESLTVSKGKRTVAISAGDESHSVGGKRSLTVTGDETRTSEAKLDQAVGGEMTLTVSGGLTIKVSGNVTIEAGDSLALKSGSTLSISAGSSLSLEAGTSASLSAGTSLEASGGTSVSVKGAASGEIDGGGMLTVKGGMIKLN